MTDGAWTLAQHLASSSYSYRSCPKVEVPHLDVGGHGAPLDNLAELAALAGRSVVAVASTDGWEAAKRQVARLLGRGDTERQQRADERLEQTRRAIQMSHGQELEQVRAQQEVAWRTRLADLLEEHRNMANELRIVIVALESLLAASADSNVANRDVRITYNEGTLFNLEINAPQPYWTGPGEGGSGSGRAPWGFGPYAVDEPDRGVGAIGRDDQRPPAPVRPPFRLDQRPEVLAGREELLAEIHVRLSGDEPGAPPRIAVLAGLEGTGKTAVAVEYARRHQAEFGVVWQFAAREHTDLAAGFSRLAAALDIPHRIYAGDPVKAVHNALSARAAEWLLIFDDVPNRSAIADVLPREGNGRILVTSQSQLWPSSQKLDVPVLDTETATAFLVNKAGKIGQEARALELAQELGGLPLALEQAIAYMLATGRDINGYLEVFKWRRADLLTRDLAGHGKQVYTTWDVAFEQLGREAPGAAGLLRLLACYSPEAIPLRLLLQPRPEITESFDPEVALVLGPLLSDQVAVDDAVIALRRFSLININSQEGTGSVHRLVQIVTLERLSPKAARSWRRAAATVLEAAVPADDRDQSTLASFAALLPHVREVLSMDSPAMARVADYLGWIGDRKGACALYQQIVQARSEVYGAESPSTLTARASLAFWTGEAGDAAAARDQYRDLLPLAELRFGPEDPDTLAMRANLARAIGGAGEAAAARDQFAALLPIRERVSGSEHPDTLTVRASLATWTGAAGDAAAARDQFAALLPVRERVSGPEHPDTLTVRGNLARMTGEAGDAAAARDLYAELLPIRERRLGPEQPRTLTVRANLARFTGEAGDAAGARDQYADLLPVCQRVLGPDQPHTLIARASLYFWTGAAGDAVSARDNYKVLLPDCERVLGRHHPDTLAVRASLARFTGLSGDAAAARSMYEALLPIRERVSGPEHPTSLTVRTSLALWTGATGDAAAARDQFAALLPIRKRVSGPEHPDTLTVRSNLARMTGEAGDPESALEQYAQLLPVRIKMLGPEHPRTLNVLANIARFSGEAGDAAPARDKLADLLPVCERTLGPEHPQTLICRASLAFWAGMAGDAAAARDQFATLLPIRERISGRDHPDTQAAQRSLDWWANQAQRATADSSESPPHASELDAYEN